MSDHTIEIKSAATAVAQASPSLAAIVLWVGSKPIDYWLAASGMVFIWLQIGYLLWRWLRDRRREQEGKHPVVDDFGDEVRGG